MGRDPWADLASAVAALPTDAQTALRDDLTMACTLIDAALTQLRALPDSEKLLGRIMSRILKRILLSRDGSAALATEIEPHFPGVAAMLRK